MQESTSRAGCVTSPAPPRVKRPFRDERPDALVADLGCQQLRRPVDQPNLQAKRFKLARGLHQTALVHNINYYCANWADGAPRSFAISPLLDLDPDTVLGSIRQRRDQLPDALGQTRGLGIQIELPLAPVQLESIACRRFPWWRRIDGRVVCGRITVLGRLECVHSGHDRGSITGSCELDRNGAAGLQGLQRVSKTASRRIGASDRREKSGE